MSTCAVTEADRLRDALVALRQRCGLELTALAEGVEQVRLTKLWATWGFLSFSHYLLHELQLPLGTGERLAALYRLFRASWDRAQRIPWHHLVEAAPVVVAGLSGVPAVLDVLEQPGASRRGIRRWARGLLLPPVNVDDPEATPDLDGDELKWGEPGRRPADFDGLVLVPGLRVVRRSERSGRRPERVLVGLLLERPVYDRLAAALAGPGPVADRLLRLLPPGAA